MSSAEGPETTIVIPAFDEAERLPRTLQDLRRQLAVEGDRYEIVLSDDGSSDGTAATFERCAAGMPSRVVRSPTNRGKGHAVRLGMLAARGAIRVMYDADGSMPASELPRLLEPVRQRATSIAIASRYLDGRRADGQPAWRRAWSRFAHAIVERTLVPGIQDTHCGYKAFSATAAEAIFRRTTIDGWAFDYEVLALAQRLGYPVLEASVEWTDDRRSRVRALRDFGRSIRETLQIRSNFRRGVYRLEV